MLCYSGRAAGRIWIEFIWASLSSCFSHEADVVHMKPDTQEAKDSEAMLELLTPICKGFMTDLGFESSNLGMQVLGGHGYIREHGMEQLARDARITTLYEGTTGIQALDLMGRKTASTKAAGLKLLSDFLEWRP